VQADETVKTLVDLGTVHRIFRILGHQVAVFGIEQENQAHERG
jgi:hypothetical protein